MSCGAQTELLLQAYVDGELDLVRSLDIEQHLSGCEVCAASVKSRRALSTALGAASLSYELPKSLQSRVVAALGPAPTEARTASRPGLRWLTMAASLTLVAIVGWAILALPRAASGTAVADEEIVSAHVRSLMADHLTDVPSSDQHTVKPWFNGKLDYSPEVRDLSAEGYPLVGGRLDYLARRGVAALVYERRKHPINVFLWPEPDGKTTDASEREASLRGYHVIRWTRAGTGYAAVSDLNVAELRELVRDLQR
jgi:anti-sigma factor RsiW